MMKGMCFHDFEWPGADYSSPPHTSSGGGRAIAYTTTAIVLRGGCKIGRMEMGKNLNVNDRC